MLDKYQEHKDAIYAAAMGNIETMISDIDAAHGTLFAKLGKQDSPENRLDLHRKAVQQTLDAKLLSSTDKFTIHKDTIYAAGTMSNADDIIAAVARADVTLLQTIAYTELYTGGQKSHPVLKRMIIEDEWLSAYSEIGHRDAAQELEYNYLSELKTRTGIDSQGRKVENKPHQDKYQEHRNAIYTAYQKANETAVNNAKAEADIALLQQINKTTLSNYEQGGIFNSVTKRDAIEKQFIAACIDATGPVTFDIEQSKHVVALPGSDDYGSKRKLKQKMTF